MQDSCGFDRALFGTADAQRFIMRSARLAAVLAALVLWSAPAVAALQPQPAHISAEQGAALYQAACATCHGADGRGAPKALTVLEDPLPDFADCGFATREPDADWLAVVHDGGPARAFGRMMPAFGGVLTTAQMQAVLGHVRRFCGNAGWPRGELNLPRPLVTEKAFPEDEAVLSTGAALEGPGRIDSKLVYERRIGARNQIELVVPFAFGERAGPGGPEWMGSIGDVAVGIKRAMFHDFERGTIVSAAAEVILPTGNDAKGMGKGTTTFEPFLAFGQILPADGFVQAQAGLELPADPDRAEPEAFWRLVAGRTVSERRWYRAWSPMVELLAARELRSGARIDWDLVPQVQVSLSRRQHVLASAGLRVPLTNSTARPTQLLFYLLWDWFDGPLFGGW
jgi:mono/diheme cytochrome c family protein